MRERDAEETEKAVRERETLPPDADTTELHRTKRKSGAGKKVIVVVSALILLVFVFLKVNERFAINDSLPMWDDLYYVFGLRSRTYSGFEQGTVSVHFIDVGQGDCALIRTENRNILIDCGEYDRFSDVAMYLRGAGVDKLDTVIMSHPHSDHMGCMYRVVKRFGAGELMMPEIPEYMAPATSSYTKLLDIVSERGIPVIPARPLVTADTGGNGTLTFVAPVKEYEDLNNFSDAVRFTYGDVSFLFCGDIESEAETDILASGADISADVIKVPHHGSPTSSARLFVQAVMPRYAVYCVGEENDYGHPNADVVKLYEALGAETYRTDIDGDIVFVTDGEYIDIYTENRLPERDAA